MSKASKKIEKLAGDLSEARGVAMELRQRLSRAEEARAPHPVETATPPVVTPAAPVRTHRAVHRELQKANPYLAAQYVLNHQHELDAPAPDGAA